MLCHSVRRVPPPDASSSHRISLYSSTLGSPARVTVVSSGVGVPTAVSFTVPAVPRFPSASKGAHSRRCAGPVSACQTFPGEWRSFSDENQRPLLSVLSHLNYAHLDNAERTRESICATIANSNGSSVRAIRLLPDAKCAIAPPALVPLRPHP
jgi:hypothetical protein